MPQTRMAEISPYKPAMILAYNYLSIVNYIMPGMLPLAVYSKCLFRQVLCKVITTCTVEVKSNHIKKYYMNAFNSPYDRH